MADVTTDTRTLDLIKQSNNAKTVIDYGADPTGKSDSSAAFQAAADAADATIRVPSWGRYRIDKTVTFKSGNAYRKLMIGQSFSHFGSNGARASVFPGPNLTGVMFDGAYIVERIAFLAEGNKSATALELNSYANQIIGCSFNGFKRAISSSGGVNQTYARNQFTGCTEGIYSYGGVATIGQFKENLFQYVDNCIIFENEAHGMSFHSNTFERIAGYPIRAKSLIDASFINNWFENTNGAGEDRYPVTTSMSQQIQSAYSAGNHCQAGFRNIFNDTTHNGRVGGIITDGNNLIVRDPTGNAARLVKNGLYQELDDWVSAPPDFVFRTGHAAAAQKGARMIVQTAKGGPIRYESHTANGANRFPFSGGHYFLRAIDGNGNDLYNRHTYNEDFGLRVKSEINLTDGTRVDVEGSTGLNLKWRADDKAAGLDIFTSAKATQEGAVTLDASKKYYFHNPTISVTVMDRGVALDGVEYVMPASDATYKHKCCGFKLYFIDRQTGQPKTPVEFHATIVCLP